MTGKDLEKILVKLDALLALMEDVYLLLAHEATKAEVEGDAPSDSL